MKYQFRQFDDMAENSKQTEKSRQAEKSKSRQEEKSILRQEEKSKSRQAEKSKSRQAEKSRHEYKTKHWTSKCAQIDNKIGKSKIVLLTENSIHYTVENKVDN